MQSNSNRLRLLSCLSILCFISSAPTFAGLTAIGRPRGGSPAISRSFQSELPAPWNDVDVGTVRIPGSAVYGGDSFTVTGSGARIGGTSDAFNYVYQPDTGDSDIEVHVTAPKARSGNAKSGIMMRGDLSSGACYVAMLLSSGSPMLQFRKFNGIKTKVWTLSQGPSDLSWLKLSRSGNAFSGYASSDGVNWNFVGTINVSMSNTASVGLAVNSGTNTGLYQASFDSINYHGGTLSVSSLTLNPANVVGGAALQGTVTINSPAPPQGISVSLVSTNPSAVTVPPTVTFSGGSTSATFAITTSPVAVSTSTQIVASYGTSSTSALLTLLPNTVVIFLSSISLNPASVVGGIPSQGTVTLNAAAPADGAVIPLTSSVPSVAAVPAFVTVLAGSSSATFAITTNPVAASSSPSITAAWGSISHSVTITVLPPVVSALSLNPNSVVGGNPSQGTVTLSGGAPLGGAVVSLSSSSTSAGTVPASVIVQQNLATGTFIVTTSSVSVATPVTITATYNGVSKPATLTVQPAPPSLAALSSLGLNPSSVTGGSPSTGTVTLTGGAPAAGALVTLQSSNTSVATVPASVTVQPNLATGTFTVTTNSVSVATPVTITATYNGVSKPATLTVQPAPPPLAALSSLGLNPSSVTGGSPSTGTVTLTGGAPAAGALVTLQSSNTSVATVPASVTVQQNLATGTFTVTTNSVPVATPVTITATYNGVSKPVTLTVQPAPPPLPALSSLGLNPTSVTGGSPSTGTVTLTSGAPVAGAVLTLQSSDTSVATVPASVTVQQGLISTTFNINTNSVTASTSITISATYGSITRTATLAVSPSSQGSGTIYYVSPSGSNSNPGTQAAPFATIQHAADLVNPGDTVIVQDGVYTDSPSSCGANPVVCINRGGTANNLVTFRAEHKWGARIDAQKTHDIGFRFSADYVRIEGFEIVGTVERGFGGSSGIELYNGGNFSQIVGNNIHDTGRQCLMTSNPNYYNGQNGIYTTAGNVTFEQNVIHDVGRYAPGENGCNPDNDYYMNHDHGIYQGGGDNNVIRNNIFYNNKRGWDIQGSGSGDRIFNNTFAFANPYRAGAIVDNGLSNYTIENNIFYQKTAYYSQPSSGTVRNNITTESSMYGDGSGSDPNNQLNTNPMLMNAAGFNFHLSPGSPAIGAGLFHSLVPFDFDGKPRPNPPSIGAFEP